MKHIKVLGTGCSKCIKTAELFEKYAKELNVAIDVTKETDPRVIMAYGVMSTPAVVMEEELVHSGSIPNSTQVKEWLAE
ncbi:thioredoxin family protein [Alteromonas sp. M12]|uniref:thioredoxin family protein n=1 Tax=Alteromonas sp. M12 TaxID=3135644 RepID=UPI00319DF7FF